MIVAHGGTAGAIVESAVVVGVLLVALLAWRASRAEDEEHADDDTE